MESAGKPTIEEAQVINEDLGNSPGKFDSLFVATRSSEFVDVVEEEISKLYGNDIGITTVKAIHETHRGIYRWDKCISFKQCNSLSSRSCWNHN
jgi:hypothetical protein